VRGRVLARFAGDCRSALVVGAPSVSDRASSVLTGRRLGVYQLLERIGAGGMGEVYRARDTKLGRDVAIKVLPRAFTAESDRLARFEREARLLAALYHPNIATIHGVEDSDDVRALVMELVEGPTLADQIAQGPMSMSEALTTARQIAEGLEAAHERGVIHRDLKPANIKVRPDGTVKLLDFGLAKALVGDGPSPDLSQAPTETPPGTREGLILGTPAYMSPEQVRGKPVDKRADIWAFGSVLYEMLTARVTFARPTVSDTLAAILEHEPDWQALPAATPPAIHRLLRRCLRKDSQRRLHDIADARIELDEAASPRDDRRPAERPRDQRIAWLAGAGFLLAGAVAVFVWRPQASTNDPRLTTGPMTRLTWDSGLTTEPSISADGRLIAYASDRSGDGNLDIWVQQTSGGAPIRRTADATDDREPDVSPDGSRVVFRSERQGGGVYVVPTLGGDARLIAPQGKGPKFSRDGRSIAFWTGPWLAARVASSGQRRTFVVSVDGGDAVQVASELASAGDPLWSPSGNELLVFGRRTTSGADAAADWWWVPLKGGAATATGAYSRMSNVGILTPPPGGSDFPYPQAWTEDGVLFTATAGSGDARNIWTMAIDPRTGRATGDPRQLTAGPAKLAAPTVSRDGRLVFSDVVENPRILGLPLDANSGRATGTPRSLRTDNARLGTRASATQDGRSLVFGILGFSGSEVWLRNLETGQERQLAAVPLASINPLISPTGRYVAYTATAQERGASGGLGTGYIIEGQNGAPRKICDGCQITAFTDERHVIIGSADGQKWLLDIQTLERVHIGEDRFDLRVSWDRRWAGVYQNDLFYIVPFTPGRAMHTHDRVSIAKRNSNAERFTGWSPDNTLAYLLLEWDGFRCLYAVRIDPQTGQQQGDIFAVHHYHAARFGWGSTSHASAVVTGLFINGQDELAGNIWMTNLIRP
jgi:eukaryotic-like serine/threonine-protein kinase